MREIKFRAWDKLDENMEEVIELRTNMVWLNEYDCERFINDVIIMQYTGLKDKNGKDIYEGDILYDYEEDCVGTVFWSIAGFKTDASGFGDDDLFDGSMFEIIGNIYENTELLKEPK